METYSHITKAKWRKTIRGQRWVDPPYPRTLLAKCFTPGPVTIGSFAQQSAATHNLSVLPSSGTNRAWSLHSLWPDSSADTSSRWICKFKKLENWQKEMATTLISFQTATQLFLVGSHKPRVSFWPMLRLSPWVIWLEPLWEMRIMQHSSVYRFTDLPGAPDALDYDLLLQDRDYLRLGWKWILAELFYSPDAMCESRWPCFSICQL